MLDVRRSSPPVGSRSQQDPFKPKLARPLEETEWMARLDTASQKRTLAPKGLKVSNVLKSALDLSQASHMFGG